MSSKKPLLGIIANQHLKWWLLTSKFMLVFSKGECRNKWKENR